MTEVSITRAFECGLLHHRAGRFDHAESVYRQILQAAPAHPDALHLLGLIAHQRGQNDAALELIDAALGARPLHPGYHKDRGFVLQALGRGDEAIASYRRALELKPDLADAHFKLGNALFNLGHADAALAHYARALERFETPGFRAAFAQCLQGVAFEFSGPQVGEGPDIRSLAIRALTEPWARPADLARACIRLITREPLIGECIARASVAWPERLPGPALFGAAGFAAVLGDRLLRSLLVSAQVCELAMERFLTLARHALLESIVGDAVVTTNDTLVAERDAERSPAGGAGEDDGSLAFRCALAQQCHLNGYVFATLDSELQRAAWLRDQLVTGMQRGANPPAAALATVASYFPLATLPGIEALLVAAWPAPVAALITQQVTEPLEERRLGEQLPRLTPIDDEVSRRVRQQYEENPYPRWIRSPPAVAAQSIDAHLRSLFPLSPLRPVDESQGVDILVAGCGTGQESIETAWQYPAARVLAIDLSLASLAYAERKARELGVRNLEHAQADILRLDSIGKTFDVIACAGVLHHLADPVAGWRRLVSLLRPGGFMRIGLYSAQARAVVVAARRFIAEHGYGPTADGIRHCRQDLMSVNGGRNFAPLTRLGDFYGTGECRDLLFHVQEHRYTLAQLRDMLGELGLCFIGFLLAPGVARRYAQFNPDDPAMSSLDAWDAFEATFPDAFAGMYVFWVQKMA